ncbi:MAG: hypothetical protein LBU47_07715, partial [Christensenellaceae bacterium]|nr:hypothetical protein [Christensenellaceae bacterium]
MNVYVLAILLVALFAVASLLLLPPRPSWLNPVKNRRAVTCAALAVVGLSMLLYLSPGANAPAPRPTASEPGGGETAQGGGEAQPTPSIGETASEEPSQEPEATPIPMPGDGVPSRGGWQGT